MAFSRALFATAACALLVACSSKQEPVEGLRESVLPASVTLSVDAAVADTPVRLAEPIEMRDWPQLGGYADHAPMHMALSDRVVLTWRTKVGFRGEYDRQLNAPVVEGGRVYASTGRGGVAAVSLEDGKKLWSVDLKSDVRKRIPFAGGLAAVAGTVYVTTGTGEIFALDGRTGKEIWKTNVGAPVRSAPTVEGGQVYIVSHDNRLSVLSAVDGSLSWSHTGIEETVGLMAGSSPAVAQGIVMVAYSSGELYALRTHDGAYIWHEALSSRNALDPFASLANIVASPVIVGDVVYVASNGGQLATFELKTGRRLWLRDIASQTMPWVSGDHAFVLSESGQMVAVNRERGQVRWVHDLSDVRDRKGNEVFWRGPIVAGDRLVAISSHGYIASISPYTGNRLSLIKVADSISVSPIVASETLIFLTDKGELIAFR